MDEFDRAQALEEQEREAALMRHRHARSVLHAGPRAESDCADCGSSIPAARLRAVPYAVRCTDCQAIHEAGHESGL